MRKDTDDYLSLFLNDVPMIDSRAPAEFERGAFPHAVNLPLMNDDERRQVGTCYKEQGPEAAVRLGHTLVYGDIKTQRVAAWLEFARQYPQGYLYCFRGGMRSQISQQWMREAGCDYPRVLGGYKAMRRFLLESLERICRTQPLLILAGHTGAAKTELLQHLHAVDLEAIANHRGSAFGKKPDGQPSQIDFENRVIIGLIKLCHQAPAAAVTLEDESRLIGRCALPPVLRESMAAAPVILLESDLESRVEHSWQNYILRKSAEWQARTAETTGGDPAQAFEFFAADLREALHNIRRRLGSERYEQLRAIMESAIQAHRLGDTLQHKNWIRCLLRDYYDPMYEWQWQRHHHRVVFKGNAAQVKAWYASGQHLRVDRV